MLSFSRTARLSPALHQPEPHLCLHLLVGLDGPWLGHNQAAPQVLPLQASDQGPKVITCLSPLQALVEHLNAYEGAGETRGHSGGMRHLQGQRSP